MPQGVKAVQVFGTLKSAPVCLGDPFWGPERPGGCEESSHNQAEPLAGEAGASARGQPCGGPSHTVRLKRIPIGNQKEVRVLLSRLGPEEAQTENDALDYVLRAHLVSELPAQGASDQVRPTTGLSLRATVAPQML